MRLTPILLLLATNAFAQPVLPEFGFYTPEEINLKSCSFDNRSHAIKLIDNAFTDYGDDGGMITRRRVRLKILNEKGLEYGNISIPFYSKDGVEYVHRVEAITVNADAEGKTARTMLDPKTVFKRKQDEFISTLSFAMPDVKAGSIIEFRYESVNKYFNPRHWDFQSELPTVRSSYHLQIPPDTEFSYSIQKKAGYNVKVVPLPAVGQVVFEMYNVPGLMEEPYMNAAGDYVQRVLLEFTGYTNRTGRKVVLNNSWSSIANELMTEKEFGLDLDKKLEDPGLSAELAKTTTEKGKLETVYKWVRDKFQWNGYNSKYLDKNFKKIMELRTGDAADLNLLLVTLLRSHGFDAHPVLVAERKFGKVDTAMPFIDRFQKPVAMVELDQQRYIMDATEKYNPVELVPASLLNTIGLVVRKKNPYFIYLVSNSKKIKHDITVRAHIKEDDILWGNAEWTSNDYGVPPMVEWFRESKKDFIEHFILEGRDGLEVDSLEFKVPDPENAPLVQRFNFQLPLERNGEFLLLDYNLFSGLLSNPFESPIRFSDVNFGTGILRNLTLRVKLPPGARAEKLPEKVQMAENSVSLHFLREVEVINDELVIQIKIAQLYDFIPVDNYPQLRSAYLKMIGYLNEQIVIKLPVK